MILLQTVCFSMKKFALSFLILFLTVSVPTFACTSVIVSSKATASGKPLMLKHRDTGELNNRIEYFDGSIYSFIGLVNSPSEGGEVWTGTNSVGFSIMNTASYNIKDDDVPDSEMDREGELMFRALGVCSNLSDFENMLDKMSKPYGVEANFGVIDAEGGAAYYEINNHSWIKYDVNESERGYRVVTNFSESGRREDYRGYERYLTASSIMDDFYSEAENGVMNISPFDLFYGISRSYKHNLIGIDYLNDFQSLKDNYGFSGIVADQDFIPRRSTAASIVIEGVKKGENPLHTVMWTILGHPVCSVAVPLLVCDQDILPYYVKSFEKSKNSSLCNYALKVRSSQIYKTDVSYGEGYVDLNSISELIHCCLKTESMMEYTWQDIYDSWISDKISLTSFKIKYREFCLNYYLEYIKYFTPFMQ